MWSIWKRSSFKILSLIPNHIPSKPCQKYIKFLHNPVQFLCRRTVKFTLFSLVRLFMFSTQLSQLYFWSHQHQNKHHFPEMVSGYSPFNVSSQTAVLMLFLLFPSPLPTFHIACEGSLSVVPCETFLHHLTECPQSEWWFAFSSVLVLYVHLCKINNSFFMNAVKLFFHKPALVFHLWLFPGKMGWQRVSQQWLGNSPHFCFLCLHQTSLNVHTHPQAYIFL